MSPQKPSNTGSMPPAPTKPASEPIATQPLSETQQDHVNAFFAFIERYCAGDRFKHLEKMCHENTSLKTRINDLDVAHRVLVEALAESKKENLAKEDVLKQLEREQEAAKKDKAQVQNLEEEMKRLITTSKSWEKQATDSAVREKARSAELKKAKEDMGKVQRDFQSTREHLTSKTTELSQVRHQFNFIRSFASDFDSLADKEAQVQSLLASFFDLASRLMETFLLSELDAASLTDHASWNELRSQVSSNERIPLPASNNPATRHIRIAAGLIVFSRALARYVFRSAYVTQGDELDIVLDDLGPQNPLQEMYVRATFLNVLPERQKRNQKIAVGLVTEQVSLALTPLVPPPRRNDFKSALEHTAGQICQGWSSIQRLEEKIKPSFSFDIPEDWLPLPLPNPQSPSSSVKPNARSTSSSQSSLTQQQKKGGGQGHQSASATSHPVPTTNEEFREVVWPAFLATSIDNPQEEVEEEKGRDDIVEFPWALISQGYVLTKTQADSADRERLAEQANFRKLRKTVRQNGGDPRQVARNRRNSGLIPASSLPESQGAEAGRL